MYGCSSILTSLGGYTSIPGVNLEFTASSFIDKNCNGKQTYRTQINYKTLYFTKNDNLDK
jgi:hypothetical protein